jgi:hypothetical protein
VETGRGSFDLLCFVIAAGDAIDPDSHRKQDEQAVWGRGPATVEWLGAEWGLDGHTTARHAAGAG